MRDYASHVACFISDFADETLMVSDAMGYEANPDFIIDREHFNNNLIMFVLSGCLVVEQYGEIFEITSSNGILMDLRDAHKYYFGEKQTEIIWLHFRGTPAEAIMTNLHRGSLLPLHFKDPSFEDMFLSLYHLTADTQLPDEFEISAAIYKVMMHSCQMARCNEQHLSDSFFAAASRYVFANLDEDLGLEDFAAHMKMSKYHFCRKFRQEFGSTPLAYIKLQKIRKAKRLLVYTRLPISEIACRLSFYDQSHFSRVFTQLTGVSPGKFRKNGCEDGI